MWKNSCSLFKAGQGIEAKKTTAVYYNMTENSQLHCWVKKAKYKEHIHFTIKSKQNQSMLIGVLG